MSDLNPLNVNKKAFSGMSDAEIATAIGKRKADIDKYEVLCKEHGYYLPGEYEMLNASPAAWKSWTESMDSAVLNLAKQAKSRKLKIAGWTGFAAAAVGLIVYASKRG